jgi:prepilin-type N-terminal cleavage/methylation domain-containing protein
VHAPPTGERGITLIELMIALVVLSLGVLLVGQLFPAGERGELKDRMITDANYYAQQEIEELQGVPWSDARLSVGTHPATGYEAIGSNGQWHRTYVVTSMSAPLDNLRKITVTVSWTFLGNRAVTATTYLRR